MIFAAALGSATSLVAYMALFAGIGFAFIFVNLLIGRFVRPDNPSPEKQEIYECGEPTIGSSFVQFDLRFYVVALVFIIFDVEVAFLFPWATVFGKGANLWHHSGTVVETVITNGEGVSRLTPDAVALYRELGVKTPTAVSELSARAGAQGLTELAVIAGGIFFAVLFVGFAYEWKTGALDWVRAIRAQHQLSPRPTLPKSRTGRQESVLSA